MVSTRRNRNDAGTMGNGVGTRAAAAQRRQQRQASAPARRRGGAAGPAAVPEVLQEMLVEAGVRRQPGNRGSSPPPVKRLKRPGEKSVKRAAPEPPSENHDDDDEDEVEDEDDDMAFEDIEIPTPVIQTTERASDEEDDGDDDDDEEGALSFEHVDDASQNHNDNNPASSSTTTLELNLSEHVQSSWPGHRRGGTSTPPRRRRRPPLSRAERARRLVVHKVHVLCLLAHAARRNRWCSSSSSSRTPAVYAALRPLLPDRIVAQLHPERRRDGRGRPLTQFGQTESLKAGLTAAAELFQRRFRVTARGLRRALWAAEPTGPTEPTEPDKTPRQAPPPDDAETILDLADFVAAARTLRGSRDVGAQLFCALLRSVGVEARLVCSLQPLPFQAGAPTRSATTSTTRPSSSSSSRHHRPRATADTIPSIYRSPPPPNKDDDDDDDDDAHAPSTTPLRRLGHPHAAAYALPAAAPPARRQHATPPPQAESSNIITGESPFPVYWVEVLDVAHQKWQPVDPLVTGTLWRPAKLEPPASDAQNQLTYAIAFAADGSARDVTRRYAKAFHAKTRQGRVEGAFAGDGNEDGEQWLRHALRRFRRRGLLPSDLDQIEDAELAAAAAREPLPRNVADYLHHPVYALARHLRRHEVLPPDATAVGTVAVGGASERIYRRRDVRVAYSADKWYRLGRVVQPGALPAKWLPKTKKRKDDDNDDNDDDEVLLLADGTPRPNGIPLFTLEQTDLYTPPPVVHGRIPKNRFGNIDLYVPSMVPAGAVHVDAPEAARAAALLRVDAAPALTGFRFEGRRGTAVLRGAVVAAEHADAVRAVIDGLRDVAAADEAERRAQAALRVWAVFLRGLRIRQRIWAAAQDRGEDVDGKDGNNDRDLNVEQEQHELENAAPTDIPADSPEYDHGGGGFLPE